MGVDEISNIMDDWQTHARFEQMTKQQREKLTSILSESLDQSTSDGKLLRTRTLLKFQSLASGKPISENYWIGKLALDNDNDKLLSDTIKKLDSDDLTADSLDGYRGGAVFRWAALRLIENGKHQDAKSFIKRVESGGEFKADEIVKLALALST